MSRDQRSPRICGKCGRICRVNIEKRWCPFTAQAISYRRNAESCRLYVPEYGRDARHSGKSEDDNVC